MKHGSNSRAASNGKRNLRMQMERDVEFMRKILREKSMGVMDIVSAFATFFLVKNPYFFNMRQIGKRIQGNDLHVISRINRGEGVPKML